MPLFRPVFSKLQLTVNINLEKMKQVYFTLTISLKLTKITPTLNCSRNVAR